MVIGCSGSISEAEALTNLKRQAEELPQAVLTEDHQRMADLTHPVLLKYLGGRDKFIQKVKDTSQELRDHNFRFKAFRFEEPTSPVRSAGEFYAIYPYQLDMTTPDGDVMTQKTYLICVSGDGGRTWKFIDGYGIKGDRTKLKTVLPQFPDQLSLPDPSLPVRIPAP
jgi:hypothetical protein